MDKEAKEFLKGAVIVSFIILAVASVIIGGFGIASAWALDRGKCLDPGFPGCNEWEISKEDATNPLLPFQGWEIPAFLILAIILTEAIFIVWITSESTKHWNFRDTIENKLVCIFFAGAYSVWVFGVKDIQANAKPEVLNTVAIVVLAIVGIIAWFGINHLLVKWENKEPKKKRKKRRGK